MCDTFEFCVVKTDLKVNKRYYRQQTIYVFFNNVIIHKHAIMMTTTAGNKIMFWKQTQISQKVSLIISIIILCIAWFEEQDSLQIKKKKIPVKELLNSTFSPDLMATITSNKIIIRLQCVYKQVLCWMAFLVTKAAVSDITPWWMVQSYVPTGSEPSTSILMLVQCTHPLGSRTWRIKISAHMHYFALAKVNTQLLIYRYDNLVEAKWLR